MPAPLGLLQLAGGLLTVDGSQVRIIDIEADQQKTVDVVKEVGRFDPDVTGLAIQATAAHATSAEMARRVKAEKKETLLAAGGHHATFVPFDLLRNDFDVVALGEGDQTVVDIARSLQYGRGFEEIPGVLFNKSEGGKPGIVQTAPRALIPDLGTFGS